jgi:hypothetical protein
MEGSGLGRQWQHLETKINSNFNKKRKKVFERNRPNDTQHNDTGNNDNQLELKNSNLGITTYFITV